MSQYRPSRTHEVLLLFCFFISFLNLCSQTSPSTWIYVFGSWNFSSSCSSAVCAAENFLCFLAALCLRSLLFLALRTGRMIRLQFHIFSCSFSYRRISSKMQKRKAKLFMQKHGGRKSIFDRIDTPDTTRLEEDNKPKKQNMKMWMPRISSPPTAHNLAWACL